MSFCALRCVFRIRKVVVNGQGAACRSQSFLYHDGVSVICISDEVIRCIDIRSINPRQVISYFADKAVVCPGASREDSLKWCSFLNNLEVQGDSCMITRAPAF